MCCDSVSLSLRLSQINTRNYTRGKNRYNYRTRILE
jgi:hypothetical protein